MTVPLPNVMSEFDWDCMGFGNLIENTPVPQIIIITPHPREENMLFLKRPFPAAKWIMSLTAFILFVGIGAQADPIPYEFRIDTVNGAALSEEPVYVDIIKSAGSEPIHGFDFLIGYDSGLVSLGAVFPGELIENGIMEYFTWRTGLADTLCPNCPTHIIRIVGVHEINDGNTNPNPPPTGNGQFLELVFNVAPGLEDTPYIEPLRFYWRDCSDNAIALSAGAILAVSDRVFSAHGADITNPQAVLPTIQGAPSFCFEGSPSPPVRMINFHDGYIANSSTINWIGDINLNYLNYEIADMVLFTNYFIYGLSAFHINPELQIAATDINGDGLCLTYADLVLMLRIIEGTYIPNKGGAMAAGTGMIEVSDTDSSLIISGDFSIPVGILALDFSAPDLSTEDISVNLSPAAAHIGYGYEVVDGQLRLLLLDQDFEDTTLADGSLPAGAISIMELKSAGALPEIISAAAAGFWGQPISVYIGELPNVTPEFLPYPSLITNDPSGIFTYDFDAVDGNGDPLTFHMVDGVGEIDPNTGVYTFGGTCCPMDTIMFVEICAGDPLHPCPQADPQDHARFALLVIQPTPNLGDVDQNWTVDILDIIVLIQYKFQNGPPPIPMESGDIDRNGAINVLDILDLINYKFKNGTAPSCS